MHTVTPFDTSKHHIYIDFVIVDADGKLLLPSATICGQTIESFNVMVTRFDPAWGIAALIGLDFFRRFKVTIDYGEAVLVCEPLQASFIKG